MRACARKARCACACPGPASAELEAVIVNTAGGVAGGDRFTLDVTVEPERAARRHDGRGGKGLSHARTGREHRREARRRRRLPRSPGCRRRRSCSTGRGSRAPIDVDLAEDARLLLAEAIVFGRSGMGEAVDDSLRVRSLALAPRRAAHPRRGHAARRRRGGEAGAARGCQWRRRRRNRADRAR